MKRLSLWVALVGPFLCACQPAPKPEEVDSPAGPAATMPTPETDPNAIAAADDSSWRLVSGPDEAKVKVRCFFPMNEDHQWIKELNARIVATFPDQVQVEQIDWFTEPGGKVHDEAGLPRCSVYQVEGRVVVQKSQALGNWTEAELMAAIEEAVKAAYGDQAVVVPQAVPEENNADAEVGDAAGAAPVADGVPADKPAE